MLKDLRLLGKLCHICAKNQDSIIEDKVRQDQYIKIQELNEKLDLKIKELTKTTWSNERGKELKAWQKIVHTKVQQERKKEDLKDINSSVDTRCTAIQGELKHMLSSLLERLLQNIQLDRVIIRNEEQEVLLTEKNEVLNKIRSHFKKQFQKRKVSNSRIIDK